MSFTDILKKIINPVNVDLVKHPYIDFRRRKELLDHFNRDTIIDVQGFEKQVLDGAKKSLFKIRGIQIEMSIEELYLGEMLFLDMIHYLKNLGFNLYSLENGFHAPSTGKLLQVDGLFFNERY